jgi:hypothetical protein
MSQPKEQDQYSAEETERRVKAAVRGAFVGPPTPLKGIPKRNGESRLVGKAPKGVPAQSKRRQKKG